MAGYCRLCREMELRLWGKVINNMSWRHELACRLADCGHSSGWLPDAMMRIHLTIAKQAGDGGVSHIRGLLSIIAESTNRDTRLVAGMIVSFLVETMMGGPTWRIELVNLKQLLLPKGRPRPTQEQQDRQRCIEEIERKIKEARDRCDQEGREQV